jgi:FkbM family methyltransferase
MAGSNEMKDANVTLLEIVHWITASHPEIYPRLESLFFRGRKDLLFDANFLLSINESLLRLSKSQLRQDIFVLSELNFKRNGYFVEFGATNGVDRSNTHLLEKEFNWKGILAEPATIWHNALVSNRAARIDRRCVWKKTGEQLLFNEAAEAELSKIDHIEVTDKHANARASGKRYSVETVSLMDLLLEHGAPTDIDYLSIDTEGSEFEILEGFDFDRFRFRVITCEHNYSPMRQNLSDLFKRNGYRKKYEKISEFDDWWVLEN